MSDGFILTGPTQTRVFDFVRTKHALKLEQTGMKFRGGRSVIHAATDKGYVPRALVARGNLHKRREIAIAYMEYVTTLLTSGGIAKQYGEEIVTGLLTYVGPDDCGCPVYQGSDGSAFFTGQETGTMCVHVGSNS